MADKKQDLKRQVEEQLGRKAKTYVVKAGDNLSKIAKEQLGDANRWTEIAELNKAEVPNPNALKVGQELKLPTA